MNNELLIVDEFEQMLNTARKQILNDLGLAGSIRPNGIQQDPGSDRYDVGLKQYKDGGKTDYYSFSVDSAEALTGPRGGFSMDTVKDIVRREILKIFPDATPAAA